MPEPKQINPVPWALSIGIVVICIASAVAITSSCQPAKFEFFQLMKTELGGCSRNQVMPSINSATEDKLSSSATEEMVLANPDDKEVSKPVNSNSIESLTPVNVKEIKIGSEYYLTNQIHPSLFNAPIHNDKPSWGRVAPVVGSLPPKVIFTVIDKTTTFSGYIWFKIKVSGTKEDVTGWLPWGAKETPMIKSKKKNF